MLFSLSLSFSPLERPTCTQRKKGCFLRFSSFLSIFFICESSFVSLCNSLLFFFAIANKRRSDRGERRRSRSMDEKANLQINRENAISLLCLPLEISSDCEKMSIQSSTKPIILHGHQKTEFISAPSSFCRLGFRKLEFAAKKIIEERPKNHSEIQLEYQIRTSCAF